MFSSIILKRNKFPQFLQKIYQFNIRFPMLKRRIPIKSPMILIGMVMRMKKMRMMRKKTKSEKDSHSMMINNNKIWEIKNMMMKKTLMMNKMK